MTESPSSPARDPAAAILILSLGAAVGLGISRFAYALVLPDMRATLQWGYAEAGFMNTVNAAGYLIGALTATLAMRRLGVFRAAWWGTGLCVAGLLATAATANFVGLSVARLLAGIGAAYAFVGGGTLAATIAQRHPARAALLLGLFYTGPGTGIMASGVSVPAVLTAFGAGAWWIAWIALGLIALLCFTLMPLARAEGPMMGAHAETPPVAFAPFALILGGYALWGAGYIAYLTFMIAWVRDRGAGPFAQGAFWVLIGLATLISPWIWRRSIERFKGGMATTLPMLATLIGAVLPLLSDAPAMLALSGAIFGASFLAVVSSTTAFVRHNLTPSQWPKAIAAMTVAFSVGQTLGPVATGAISDITGTLASALAASAILLTLAAIACALQRPLSPAAIAS